MKIEFFKRHEQAVLPVYGSKEAAGADISSIEATIIPPGEHRLIDTGLDCRLPQGYEIQVRPRSGLAGKKQVTVLNTPGTVDPDYTGPLKVILINHGKEIFSVEVGDRIAQIVIAPITQAVFSFTNETRDTERGAAGFGSTGGITNAS